MAVFRRIPVGDLDLKNGSPYFIDGPDYIRQKLSARFKFFLGEWFLNQLEGVPYYRDVFVHDPDLDVISSMFKRLILKCPGIISLNSYAMALDPASRAASFSFQATCDGGDFVVKSGDLDFILDLSRG